ncbi:hypothetical protein Q9L58_010932, partial [Maublancomyces gigas]
MTIQTRPTLGRITSKSDLLSMQPQIKTAANSLDTGWKLIWVEHPLVNAPVHDWIIAPRQGTSNISLETDDG